MSDNMKQEARPKVQGAAAFSKFVNVLEVIAGTPGIDIARLCKEVSYPRSTVYRLVAALVAEGLVVEDQESGRFKLGIRLISLARHALEEQDLRQIAHRYLVELRDRTGETVHLAVPSGLEMTFIDKLESPRTVRMVSRIGTRIQLHSTSVGKAYLAALDPDRCDDILGQLLLSPQTDRTITDLVRLKAEIETTRERGYAIDDEENELDIRCFGAAILDRNGQPLGAVSVSTPKYRYTDNDVSSFAEAIRKTVHAIAAAL